MVFPSKSHGSLEKSTLMVGIATVGSQWNSEGDSAGRLTVSSTNSSHCYHSGKCPCSQDGAAQVWGKNCQAAFTSLFKADFRGWCAALCDKGADGSSLEQ